MNLVTVEELADFLELDAPEAGTDDERRARTVLIPHASGLVLGHLKRSSLEPEERTALLDGNGSTVLLLPGDRVVDVVEVVEDPRGDATELVDDEHFEWTGAGVLTRLDGSLWRRRARWYDVTFVEGLFPEEIDAVKGVVCRVAARALVNPEGLATESMGGYVSGFAFDETRLPTLAAGDRRDLDRYAVVGTRGHTRETAGS